MGVVVRERPIRDSIVNGGYFYRTSRVISDGSDYIRVSIDKTYNKPESFSLSKETRVTIKDGVVMEGYLCRSVDRYGYRTGLAAEVYTLDQLAAMPFYEICLINDSGDEIPIIH